MLNLQKIIKFSGIGRLQSIEAWEMKNHKHDYNHEMIVVKQGLIEVHISGEVLQGGPGHVLLYPAGVWHQEKSIGSVPLETWFFSWTLESQVPKILKAGLVFDKEARIQNLSQWLYELRHIRANPDPALLDMLCYAAVQEFETLLAPAEPAFVKAAKEYIEKNLSQKMGLEALAEAAGLSLFHFARAFKKATAVSPGEYLRRRRLELARSLLLSTPLPLKSIAVQTGFADEYVLSKTFKKVLGVTPGSLRKY